MKAFVLTLVVLVAVAAVGFRLGWFSASSHSSDGKTDITVTVDKDKMSQDQQKAEDTVQDLAHRAKEDLTTTSSPATGP
jgi:hypothetical protein